MSKDSHKLTKEQQADVLRLLAENETYSVIAAKVGCTWRNIAYYADKYSDDIAKASAEYKSRLIGRGLRDRDKRIEKLQWVASLHEKKFDEDGLDYEEVKMSTTGDVERYPVYNTPAMQQYLKIHQQIAQELGEWVTKSEGKVTILPKVYLDTVDDDGSDD